MFPCCQIIITIQIAKIFIKRIITKYITPTISNVTTEITGFSKESNFYVLEVDTKEIKDTENVQSCLNLDSSRCTLYFRSIKVHLSIKLVCIWSILSSFT